MYEDAGVIARCGRIACFDQYDHLRIFGADSAQLLAGADFRVEVARGADCPGEIRPVAGPADYDSPDVAFCFRE